MRAKQLPGRSIFELSLAQRMVRRLIPLGVPLFCWELFDLWREARHDPFFGTPDLVFGISLALLEGLSFAIAFALLEHGLILILKRHRQA